MIYFDNAATTRATDTTVNIVTEYLRDRFYNPSALYHEGLAVKQDMEKVRGKLLSYLRGDGKIIFTGGGTESDNLALIGAKKHKGGKVVIGGAEHAAIYATAMELKQRGYIIETVPVNPDGSVNVDRFSAAVTPDTTLVSVMHVSNETGAVNDIALLSAIAKRQAPNATFHSDGVQAFGKLKINLRATDVDLYSMSAHKLGAPKGLGALYIRKGVNLSPIVYGGGQEGGLRSSTENTAAIMAFGKAAEERYEDIDSTRGKLEEIRAYLTTALREIEELIIISQDNGSPYILTFTSGKVRGEVMQHALERENVIIGTGSACSSNKASARIPDTLGLKGKYKDGIVRLSFAPTSTMAEAKEFISKYFKVYKELSKYGS